MKYSIVQILFQKFNKKSNIYKFIYKILDFLIKLISLVVIILNFEIWFNLIKC